MNILIVDGNEKEASDRYTNMGMDTQFKVYEKILKNKSKTIRVDNIRLCLKRLEIDWKFIKNCMNKERKNYNNYKTSYNLLKFFKKTLKLLSKLRIIPVSHYYKFFGLKDIIDEN